MEIGLQSSPRPLGLSVLLAWLGLDPCAFGPARILPGFLMVLVCFGVVLTRSCLDVLASEDDTSTFGPSWILLWFLVILMCSCMVLVCCGMDLVCSGVVLVCKTVMHCPSE